MWRRLGEAVREGDDQAIETALVDLTRGHRLLTPLSFLNEPPEEGAEGGPIDEQTVAAA